MRPENMLRKEVKDLIKKMTGLTYKQVEKTFKFTIQTVDLTDLTRTMPVFLRFEDSTAILKYFYNKGVTEEYAFSFFARVNEMARRYGIKTAGTVVVSPWRR